LTNIIKNETAEKASALLRRIADLIDNREMAVRNVCAVVLPPPAILSPIRNAYELRIDVDFDILGAECEKLVTDIRG